MTAVLNGFTDGAPALEAQAWPTVSVVVPTLNEAANLPLVLGDLAAHYEVIIVDGYSTDGTTDVARRLRPDAKILRQGRKGKGDALARGFAAATGDIVVMLDADGSADPAEIPRFVEALVRGADFAKGSRFLRGGGSADITLLRRLGNAVLTTAVNRIFDCRYTDLCYGYNAFWRRCLDELAVCCDGFEVETSINVQVAKLGLRVEEVPSFERHRFHGSSNLNAGKDGLRVLRTIIGEWVLPKRFARLADHPDHVDELDHLDLTGADAELLVLTTS
jgi:glycosyltransferase involved in cell wall biosynthesis